jgi:hypothetical protein
MALVNDKCVIELAVKGESTRKAYKGKFVFKLFLNLRERGSVAIEVSKRDGANIKDQSTTFITQIICELQALCETCPDWFKGEAVWDLLDYEPIIQLRKELDESVAEYIKMQDEA